ncbi:MAG: hypothetical protein IPF99_28560 [Deltaproteobacteria bacterium]|nr:hypothetical protein [Deltaproteobacteria bacterium]
MSEQSTRRLLGWIIGALGALSAIKPMRESDLFWHLALGRAVLRAGRRVVPEPMSVAALGETRAVPEWLWDLACYGLWNHGGALSLTLLLALLGGLITSLGWRVLRGHDPAVSLPPAALTLALALPALVGRVRERPEVVALALLLASLLLLRRWGASPENRPRTGLALVAAGLLWAQVHGTAPLLAPMVLVSIAPSLLAHLRRRSLDRASSALLVGVTVAPHRRSRSGRTPRAAGPLPRRRRRSHHGHAPPALGVLRPDRGGDGPRLRGAAAAGPGRDAPRRPLLAAPPGVGRPRLPPRLDRGARPRSRRAAPPAPSPPPEPPPPGPPSTPARDAARPSPSRRSPSASWLAAPCGSSPARGPSARSACPRSRSPWGPCRRCARSLRGARCSPRWTPPRRSASPSTGEYARWSTAARRCTSTTCSSP